MTYQSFDNQKNKLEKIWNKNQKNIDRNIPIERVTLQVDSRNFNKLINVLPLYSYQVVPTGAINNAANFEFMLLGFPEWAIPYTYPTAIFSTSLTLDVEALTQYDPNVFEDGNIFFNSANFEFIYWWKKINDSDWILKFRISGDNLNQLHFEPTVHNEEIPIYAQINLYTINKRFYQATQHDA